MGEARALEVCDVDFKRDRILVRHALSADQVVPPKSGHERVVPLAPELRAILEEAVRRKLPHARIVMNEHGETPRRQRVLGALAGDSKLDVTQRYVHATADDLRAAITRLPAHQGEAASAPHRQ